MNRALIDKYFNGKCTPKEAAEFLMWLHSKDSDQELTGFLADTWEKMNDDFEDKPEVLSKIHRIIDHNRNQEPKTTTSFSFYLKAVASISIVLMAAVALYWLTNHNPPTNVGSELPLSMITKSTEYGQKLTIVMPDSSVVTLNSGSSVTYPPNFNDSIRIVNLAGEAFFEIKKDTIPFIVVTGKLQTRVLGTSFNIKSLESGNKIEVALLSGSVQVDRVNDDDYRVLLTPGDLMVYDLQQERFNKQKWDYKKIFGWKEGILYFEDNTLEEITLRLEQWYGVTMKITDNNSGNRHFTGSFQNASLKNVLESLSFTYGFRYKLQDQFVSIQF